MTGTVFPMLDLIHEMEARKVNNFVGIKNTGMYTYPGMMDAEKCIAYADGKYEVLFGRDELMPAALAIGIKGFIGSQYNFAAELYNQVRVAFDAGDLPGARAHQRPRALEMAVGGGEVQGGVAVLVRRVHVGAQFQ